jgi:ABC-type amino acid transport substrate-binding protein
LLQLIANNAGIDVISAGATIDREALLLPIRFPILKGLNGWRIALVAKNNKDLFLQHANLEQFKTLKAGQLHSWSDTKVIASNGIYIEKGSDYDGLFTMLENNRFDCFPRSILEVRWEYEKHKDGNIMIEPHNLIHYPTAYFFFVNKKKTQLAADISAGLEEALKDGSFERIFNKYFGSAIKEVQRESVIYFH